MTYIYFQTLTIVNNICLLNTNNNNNNYISKLSDDIAILSLVYKDQDILYYNFEIDQFTELLNDAMYWPFF